MASAQVLTASNQSADRSGSANAGTPDASDWSGNVQVLWWLETGLVALLDIAISLWAVVFRRVKRGKAMVQTEYDASIWRRHLEERAWTRFRSIQEFLHPPMAGRRISKIHNRYVRIDVEAYYKFRAKILRETLLELAVDNELVELGCGCGMNLFSLLPAGRWKRLIGLDISSHGIRAATEITNHFGLEGTCGFASVDLTNGADPNLALIKGKTVFSYYCLEQLKYQIDEVIENLLRAGPKRVIHIEPTPEVLRWWSLKDIVNYVYIMRRDYQTSLLRTLQALEKRGEVRMLAVKRLYYAPSVRNDPTLICWEPMSHNG